MLIPEQLHPSWEAFLTPEIRNMLEEIETAIGTGYTPEREQVLRFMLLDLDQCRVVILGQDPYKAPGTANGRAFQPAGLTAWTQPFRQISLKNIIRLIYKTYYGIEDYREIPTFKEIASKIAEGEFPISPPQEWFDSLEGQGVLFLNTYFTCRLQASNSHKTIWEPFSKKLIQYISHRNPRLIWFLWGSEAAEVRPYIESGTFYESRHPMMCNGIYENDFLRCPCFGETWDLIHWLGQDQGKPLRPKRPAKKAYSGIQSVLDNLPGMVICCEQAGGRPLLAYHDALLSLTGYSSQEIQEALYNQYMEFVLPEDRPGVNAFCTRLSNCREDHAEYRIRNKDGDIIWLQERGKESILEDGKHIVYSILTDITDMKRKREERQLTLDQQWMLLEQTTDIIFEWDINGDKMIASPNWEKRFGFTPVFKKSHLESGEMHNVHPEDIPALKDIQAALDAGALYAEAEFRMQSADQRFLWCHLRAAMQKDADGQPSKVVGMLIDIDEAKKEALLLQEKAQRDALTGLYNKGAVKAYIDEILGNPNQKGSPLKCSGAFLIVDVDNFKSVNDRFGHLSGDVLLTDIAGLIQKQFRAGDIIGRIGGDEYAVYMRDIQDPQHAVRKAEGLLKAFHTLLENGRDSYQISCSIGIAVTPRDGADFQTLYQNADRALYYAKSKGKDNCHMYSPDLLLLSAEMNVTTVNEEIESEKKAGTISRLAEYVFHMLYQTDDLEKAVPQIMEIIGRQFNVSRVYVFEDGDDGSYCMNTLEWCNQGISPQIQNLQRIPYTDLGDYYANFNGNGIFYCRDAGQLPPAQKRLIQAQGIRSMLQCIIRDNGMPKGFVGFDDCSGLRYWTQEQVEILTLVAEVVGIFLIKKRAQRREALAVKSLEAILDRQDIWLYVLDKQYHQILYANQKTRSLLPQIEIGETVCHRVFFNRDTPCGFCPLNRIRDGKPEEEKIYSTVLKKTVLAKGSVIPWTAGEEVFLMSCQELDDKMN